MGWQPKSFRESFNHMGTAIVGPLLSQYTVFTHYCAVYANYSDP